MSACPADCAACRPGGPVVLRDLYDEGVQVGWRVWRRVGEQQIPLDEIVPLDETFELSTAYAHRQALVLLRAARTRL